MIESDTDLICALCSFKEAAEQNSSTHYRTIHVQECVEVMLERDDRLEPLHPSLHTPAPPHKRQQERQGVTKVCFKPV